MAWWERMPKPAQAWLTIISTLIGLLGGAFALGAATSGAVRGMRGLPVRVEALEAKAIQHDAAIVATEDKLDRVVCLLLLPDSLSAITAERECP